MDHLEEETPTVVLVAQARKIVFDASSDEPHLDDRAFAATGGCELDRLAAMVKYLGSTGLFKRVTQIGIIVRIVLLPGTTWGASLNFSGEGVKRPRHLAAVREQLKEEPVVAEGDTITKKEDLASLLAYVVALLWEGAGWGGMDDVIVEESSIG